jgi:hypothetical protein
MKRIAYIISSLALLSPALAQELTGKDIIRKVSDIMNPPQMEALMTMVIETTSGEERTFLYESFSKNHGEMNLIRYLEPSRLQGQAILMLDHADVIKAYFPRTKRVRTLAEHAKRQKMEGSDFSYEDMGSGDAFLTDYSSRRLDDEKIEGQDCYKIELTRLPDSNAGYSHLIMWVNKEDFVSPVVDYYDLKDPGLKLKRLVLSDVEVIQDIPTPKKMLMKNILDNSQTAMEITSVDYEVELDDDLFTERGLRE